MLNQLIVVVYYLIKKLLPIALVLSLLLLILGLWLNNKTNKDYQAHWDSIAVGDSLFFKESYRSGIDFYRKGYRELNHYEQEAINFAREDTLEFIKHQTISKKYFYTRLTSFVGFCMAKDSSISRAGELSDHRWIQLQVSEDIKSLPQPEVVGGMVQRDLDGMTWTDEVLDSYGASRQSKALYVPYDYVTAVNQDKNYQ